MQIHNYTSKFILNLRKISIMKVPELIDEILLILNEEEMTERELAEKLRVERAMLRKVLEFLMEMDFVERANLKLKLSESGRRLVRLDVY
ncbi:predicted coding region AF_1662 [Archaeoglobus fulgidus DSM 4304]|uniref:Uncharacterized protein AF_1662 n=3 Tax=Archaeoglobus fulgidus TaxID=2234 RepID=Y1662_ARCFU|nr:RecName: Full=Uncharacterized protein AF_1662 [Archaeoglobus fulgidus DSM 4304]AAB89609.1 predicted coding region AF_1662 [Archaeoglobus fulgidus DSM 4304]